MIKPFISKEGLKELDNYKYVGGSYSWLDNKLNPYWTKLSELLPKTMAPNLVTFIGFIFILSSYATILPYDSTLKQNIPNWIFLKCGFDFFIYQTLDAMDGKQARRTKSSSPLGQLFDHGCDSFTLNFFLLVLVQAAKLDHFVLKIGFISTQILLFSANWIEYHTHVLNTQFMNFGVTESQLIAIFVCLTAGIFGQSTFQIKTISVIPSFLLNWLPVKNEIVSYILNKNVGDSLFIGLAGLTYLIFITVFIQTMLKINGKQKLEALKQYIPFISLVIIDIIWYQSPIFDDYAGFILFTFGIMHSFVICQLIICSMTKMKYPIIQFPIVFFFGVSVLYLIFGHLLSEIQLFYYFLSCGIVVIIYVLIFLSNTIRQITSFLGIYCFTLQKRPRQKIE